MGDLALNGGKPVRAEPYPSWPAVTEADVEAVTQVLRSGKWGRIAGSVVGEFEREFAEYQGAAYCLGVNSGTSALEVGLMALNLEPGAEVILCPYTFFASATSILLTGGVPIFVDMDPDTYNIDPDKIEAAITDRTAAIMAVHFAGLACDMDRIRAIASKHKLKIIEDAAHAHGAKWNGTPLGAVGDVGAFSFQASKNLNSGEGGAVLTNDEGVYSRAIDMHDLWTGGLAARGGDRGGGSLRAGRSWVFPFACHNFRMTAMQAALLRSQMGRLEQQAVRRAENGRILIALFEETEGLRNLRRDPYVTRDSHHLFIFKYDEDAFDGLDRKVFIQALNAEGIPATAGYPRGCHKQPLFTEPKGDLSRVWPRKPGGKVDVNYAAQECPNVDYYCEHETVWLPQSLLLDTRKGMEQVGEAIEKIRENVGELAGVRAGV